MVEKPAARKRSIRRRLIFALIPVTVLLVLTEAGLRIGGYQSPTMDPVDSFLLHRPLFVPDGDDLVTSPARSRYFHPQRFSRKKGQGVTRFFVFGGSAVGGANIPDSASSCFGAQLREMLEAAYPGREFEQVNCGGKSYASYRLVNLVRECLGYSPDFVIVMSGNNEFLEARHYADFRRDPGPLKRIWYDLRIVQLADELGARLRSRGPPASDPSPEASAVDVEKRYIVRSPEEFELARRQYEENLREIVDLCRTRGVPVVLSTVPSNIRNYPPKAMEGHGPLTKAELTSRFEELLALYSRGDLERTILEAKKVLAIDARAARFHFLVAHCLDELGRHDEALRSYLDAKDTDAFPHRALTPFNETVRKIASETDAEVFDAEALFIRVANDGIPGDDLFVDHCHPTREAHELIARELATFLETLGWLRR